MNNNVIIIFVCLVIFFILLSLTVLWICTYPPVLLVKKMYKYPMHDIHKFYFYYNKATAYRMLFTCFNIFGSILQVSAVASTFITVYAAFKATGYVLLFSLISATCEVVKLMLQPEKYVKVFSDAALIMECALSENTLDNELNDVLLSAYKKAENRINETK